MPHEKQKSRLTSRERIREKLIVARARAEFTQSDLADAAGIARRTVSDIERAVANPSIDVLDKLAIALSIDVSELFAAPFEGAVDAAESHCRRALPRSKRVGARDLFSAIEEAAGGTSSARPKR